MDGTTTISVAAIATVLGGIIGFLGFQRNMKSDIKNDTKENTALAVKLDYISKGVDDIRLDIKSTNREVESIKTELAIQKESLKAIHKRVDTLEKEIDK